MTRSCSDQTKKIARKYEAVAFDDYRQLVVQNALDVLIVADPMHLCQEYVRAAMKKAFKDILKVKSEGDIPELNLYQCGTYKMHSLKNAKKIAKDMLSKKIGVMSNKKLFLSEDKMKNN